MSDEARRWRRAMAMAGSAGAGRSPRWRGLVGWTGAMMAVAGSCLVVAVGPASGDAGREEGGAVASASASAFLAPSALAVSRDGRTVYVACAATSELVVLDAESRAVGGRIRLPSSPSGLVLSADGARLYVTCGGPAGLVCVVDTAARRVTGRVAAGYQAQSPVLSSDGRTLYVCYRFDNAVGVIDLERRREVRRMAAGREPFAAALTPDGRRLLVANHLPAGRADVAVVASAVTVIELGTGAVEGEIVLPNGSTLVREIRVTPDGRHAFVVHTLARYHLPTTQIERGWINTNAGSLIDLAELKWVNTVLLDNIDAGAATPWAVGWSEDGRRLLVTHAGTHELSVIDFPALLAKLARLPTAIEPGRPVDYAAASRTVADVPNDLSFLVGIRERVKLPGKGPRSLAVVGKRAWVAEYFTDTLAEVNFEVTPACVRGVALGPVPRWTVARAGESHFNDATLCFQGWQACSSCHSHDARVDGLNWDNLNDGMGNPKSGKSLLLAFATPPSMWLGVRSNAHVAVRAGIRNSLFTVQPPEVAEALDGYLQSLRPLPSPRLVKGRLSASAQRGRSLFMSETVGCSDCHRGAHYTDQRFHDVGTVGRFDQSTNRFDTPSLIEVWRSGPYLHDGRAATLREVLTTFNPEDRHGATSQLAPAQIADLVEFVLSL